MENLPKPKPVNYELIEEDLNREVYDLLHQARRYHPETAEAEIGLAWRRDWKPNQDGQISLGKCVKASDLQREFMDYDFVIVLNRDIWVEPDWTDEKKLAILDHELCHAAVCLDDEGEVIYTERGRPAYRIRKHDIEEFREVIERHGCFKSDLQAFAKAIAEGPSLFDGPVLASVDRMAQAIPEGSSVEFSVAGKEPVTLKGKGKK